MAPSDWVSLLTKLLDFAELPVGVKELELWGFAWRFPWLWTGGALPSGNIVLLLKSYNYNKLTQNMLIINHKISGQVDYIRDISLLT